MRFFLKRLSLLGSLAILFIVGGCQGIKDMDVGLAASAGRDAIKAATLSDEEVISEAQKAIQQYDSQHTVASESDPYARRLRNLVQDHLNEDSLSLNFKVYLQDEVNAFAMADGSIRVYSGLMDLMHDQEVLAVIGHEIGHVKRGHSKKAFQIAYAASAARKGVAAQNSAVGDLAASQLGALMEAIVNAQFSQSEESESDDYGLAFMQRHGYEEKALVSCLRKLGEAGGGFLASHPNPQDRADAIEAKMQE